MPKILDRRHILTEKINSKSKEIDKLSTAQIIHLMNEEDATVARSVAAAIPEITQAADFVLAAFKRGGRLRYIGAGTSGRLGVLDASECPPTFSVSPDLVQGFIAGGYDALMKAIEGAEDYPERGAEDCRKYGLRPNDVLMGIATGGTTPYVHGGLEYARSIGCKTVFLTCTLKEDLNVVADVIIEVLTGPELITGSTRMKAGTATKMVLNMITTTAMIRWGKVYGNYMVDHQAINSKLIDRGTRIISELTGLDYKAAYEVLLKADKRVKPAIVMVKKGVSLEEAQRLIKIHDGFIRFAFEN
jgi:N-acetylmuramic acid 6-phosphate etherase